MKIEQFVYSGDFGWRGIGQSPILGKSQLIFVFGATHLLKDRIIWADLEKMAPQAHLIGCSTAGEILGTQVFDDTVVATAVALEHSVVKSAQVRIKKSDESFTAGRNLALALDHNGLRHVFVLSDGLLVNGSELSRGLRENLPDGVAVTGGLAGDGARFKETLVRSDSAIAQSGLIAVVGFYGEGLKIGFGSLGGWDPFGPERLVTRSTNNVLFELDGLPALELYKKYLGEHASGLPATGLLFPLALRLKNSSRPVVRTILGVDETKGSLTFAGDIPQGAYAQLMKANFDRLIDGASAAARAGYESLGSGNAQLAILISCVGRKMVLKQRVEEEVESVREVLGAEAALAGFYSYGEICPFTPQAKCELHNQTMTITVFSERR